MTYKVTSDWQLSARIDLEPEQRFDLQARRGYGERATMAPVEIRRVGANRGHRGRSEPALIFTAGGKWRKRDGQVGQNTWNSGYMGVPPEQIPIEIREQLLFALDDAAADAHRQTVAHPLASS